MSMVKNVFTSFEFSSLVRTGEWEKPIWLTLAYYDIQAFENVLDQYMGINLDGPKPAAK